MPPPSSPTISGKRLPSTVVKVQLPFYSPASITNLTKSVDAAARVREILESAGMAQESLPSNVVSLAQVLANVANLLNIRDTELSRLGGSLIGLLLSYR